MSAIRPLERQDLPEVAALYEVVMRSGRSDPPPGLERYFSRVLLDQPWVDAEIPSLVYTDEDGSIVAFQGSSVRRAVYDGRPIRIACAGQLVAHPNARKRAVGALIVRAYLNGVQDLTITDSASERMRQIWSLLGGDVLHVYGVEWARVLRPWSSARAQLLRRRGKRNSAGGRVVEALDAVTTKVGRLAPPRDPSTSCETLTPAELVGNVSIVAEGLRLHLDYDERFVQWLFDELPVVSGLGVPVARLVRDPGNRVLGWYVYYLVEGGLSRVLQVAAAERRAGAVLDDLIYHAWSHGAAVVLGRIEPALLEPLAERRMLLRFAGTSSLAHSRDQNLLGAIATGKALLSRLDGEWWIQDKKVDLGGPP